MPGFNGTGPRGLGPMTGRGLGYCVVPIGTSYGSRKLNEPYSNINQPYPGPFVPQPYASPAFRITRGIPFWGGRGRGSRGRGRGFGRRWW